MLSHPIKFLFGKVTVKKNDSTKEIIKGGTIKSVTIKNIMSKNNF